MLFASSVFGQGKVEIVGGERMTFNQSRNHLYIVQNVVIKHNGVIIQCDSAIRKMDEGIIEGFGHIYIYQPDTFTLSGGEILVYHEDSKVATVTGKSVQLSDQKMTLTTTSLNYNTQTQTGFYSNGADILNDGTQLKSKKGFYFRRGNQFFFKDNVQLKHPDYTMYSDTLQYFAGNRTAFFYGPTKIISKENTIVCQYGWYNTQSQKAQFSKGATLYSDSSVLSADSLLYNNKTGQGEGLGNIHLYDSAEHINVYGQHGKYFQKQQLSIIFGTPVAMQAQNTDTMWLLADTFKFQNDSAHKTLKAYYHTAIYQNEFKGLCDSLVYAMKDSSIRLIGSPILWNQNNQITGDTMIIGIQKQAINGLKVIGNAFLASEVKTNAYNQIAGKTMDNHFEKNKLKSVYVAGNAISVYYIRNNETDTAEYTGINRVMGQSMRITLDSNKVSGIKFYQQVEGKMYPIAQMPESEKVLPGLKWQIQMQPAKASFVSRSLRQAPVIKTEVKATSPKATSKKRTKSTRS